MIRTMTRVRVRSGCEADVTAAWQTAADQIAKLPGSVRQELLVDALDARSLVAVTEWADRAALDAYEQGPVAARFADACRERGEASSYRVMHEPGPAEGNGSRIFIDVEITVPAARRPEFEAGYPRVLARMSGVPGYLREELLHEPGSDSFHIFAEWHSEAELNHWIGNPAHKQEEAGPIAPFLLEFRRRLFHADSPES